LPPVPEKHQALLSRIKLALIDFIAPAVERAAPDGVKIAGCINFTLSAKCRIYW